MCAGARLTQRYFYESFTNLDELELALLNQIAEEIALEELEASGLRLRGELAGGRAVRRTHPHLHLRHDRPPKGVELTHANLLAEMDALKGYFPHHRPQEGADHQNIEGAIKVACPLGGEQGHERPRRPAPVQAVPHHDRLPRDRPARHARLMRVLGAVSRPLPHVVRAFPINAMMWNLELRRRLGRPMV